MTLFEAWISRLAALCAAITLALVLGSVVRAGRLRRGRKAGAGSSLLGWPITLAAAAAFIAVGTVLWRPIPLAFDPAPQVALTGPGALLYFPGLSLYLWGFFTLGAMFGVSCALGAELYEGHRLIETGPYAFVRHPMYLGVILTAFGALLIFRTWAMLVAAPLVLGLAVRARREETLLAAEFGEKWETYARRVPAWLPRLRPRG